MSAKAKTPRVELPAAYRELPVGPPAAAAALVLLLLCAPSLFWMHRTNAQNARGNDVADFHALRDAVGADIRTVDALLRDDAAALAALEAARKAPVVRLITPEVVVIEEKRPVEPPSLKGKLEAIYWSPANPLATIDGETYRVGDTLQGFEIVAIEKSTVHLKGGDGKVVVKDIDEEIRKYAR